jgi:hypothetical protein
VATQAGTADQLVDFVNTFDLLMDTASRLARTANGLPPDTPLYYGTNETLSALKTGHTTAEGLSYPGVPLALDPAMASDLAARAAENIPGGQPEVMRLWHRADRPRVIDLTGEEPDAQVIETLRDAFKQGHDAVILQDLSMTEG